MLKSPKEVHLASVSDIPQGIEHSIYFADDHNHKMELLDALLARPEVDQAIVFATTQEGTEELGTRLIELGETLEEAEQDVALNHPHCAKFCVLGGASCSA